LRSDTRLSPHLREIERSPAVQLFVERARAVEPHFVLDAANAPTVAAICRRLDGLPLAIELAAVHMRFLSAAELLARLEPALPLLANGPTDAPDRLRTMRNAIAWSYNRLAPAEQTLLRRLSIFVAGCSVAAAEAVAADASHRPPASRKTLQGTVPPAETPSFLETVASLVDASLVQPHETGGETRLTMLETIREFGLERLAASGEMEAVAARHATWHAELAERVWRAGGVSHGRGLALLEGEHPNLRAALTWFLERDETTAALHLAGQLAEFWMRHGHLAEGQAYLERALAADEAGPTAARTEALVGLTMLLWMRDDFAHAERLLGEAETVARAAGNAEALAYARLHQGYVAFFRGDLDQAVARGEECLESCAAMPQGFSCHGPLWILASATLERGDHSRATALYEQLLASARAEGDEVSIANGHRGLAILAKRRGELHQALAGFVEGVCSSAGDRWSASQFLEETAAIAVALGQPEPAVRLYAAVDALRAAVGAAAVFAYVPERPLFAQSLAAARAALGEERFATAWAAGAALSFDEAIAEIRALADQVSAKTSADREARPVALTGREGEVLRLMADGLGDKAIAAALGISRRTASQHVAAILAKLGDKSRTAAVSRALRQGLLGISHSESS
jgi:non-specific serine/threonine protein kinase